MVYGKVIENPVKEFHQTLPLSVYGSHKRLSEQYLELYQRNFQIPYTIIRITNPYGIKQQVKHSKYSIVGWFIRQALEGKKISIYGSGEQKRDYIYISDISEAIYSIAFNEKTINKIYNLGYGKSIQFKEMVETIIDVVENGSIEYIKWPKDYEKIETGNFEVCINKLKKDTGWSPKTEFKKGIVLTFEYYKKFHNEYF
jgi:UDP-glucose 4-epimerase